MSELRESSRRPTTPSPDEAVLAEARTRSGQGAAASLLRTLGAIAVLVVGAMHLEQYFAVKIDAVRIIGPLFVLNFAGATLIGAGLLIPAARMRPLHLPLALGGIGLAATAFVFLFISEHQPLFGFQEHNYRTAIVVALAAEAVAVVSLLAYLAFRRRALAN
jgi:hypothetical protein